MQAIERVCTPLSVTTPRRSSHAGARSSSRSAKRHTAGWQHLGVVWSGIATEVATALLIIATLILPLAPMLAVLPLLGIVLNGTFSVLYGNVPDLAPKGDIGRGFALFYTGFIGAGGLAPIAYVAIADHSTRTVAILAAALTAAVIVPLVIALRPALKNV